MRHTHSRVRSVHLALGITLALAASAVLGGVTNAATQTPFDKNLVKNPGAEAGAGTSGNTPVQIPNWSVYGAFTVVRYGAAGFPAKSESTRIGGGHKFFSCGPNSSGGHVVQTVQLHGLQTLIDNGHVKVILKARLASYASQQDSATASVHFYNNASGTGYLYAPAVVASDDLFISKSASRIVPPGTTFLQVELYGVRANNGGTYCDAYFDNISVVLKQV